MAETILIERLKGFTTNMVYNNSIKKWYILKKNAHIYHKVHEEIYNKFNFGQYIYP